MTKQDQLIKVAATMEQMIDDGLPPFDESHYDAYADEVIFLWHAQGVAIVIELSEEAGDPEARVTAALGMPSMN